MSLTAEILAEEAEAQELLEKLARTDGLVTVRAEADEEGCLRAVRQMPEPVAQRRDAFRRVRSERDEARRKLARLRAQLRQLADDDGLEAA